MADFHIKDKSDITEIVKSMLEKTIKGSVKIIFPKGTYYFSPEKSFSKFQYITNHDSGDKKIAFYLSNLKNVEIDGQGSEFIFRGRMLPFLIENCENVNLKNFSIDWDIPFFVQGEVMATNSAQGWYDLSMDKEGYSYKVVDGHLKFPVNTDFNFLAVGESLVFDKISKSPIYNADAYDIHRKKNVKVEQLQNGNIRFLEKLKEYPPVNSIMTFKGEMGENRYAPAFHCLKSKSVQLYNINVYHALGMGFLGEKSEDILLRKFNVSLRKGSNRYISSTADATHFCNCKGNVEMDSCLFENMLDDGTNVHGTYIKVDSVISKTTVRASLQHFQQAGFIFGEKGDKVWFLIAPNPSRSNENTIVSFKSIDKFQSEITFRLPLTSDFKKGDLIENKTWNTSNFTLHNSIIRNNRARNIVLKAPGKIFIENNYFQSMMASILIRAEASLWYESGAVENVLIRNNKFENCVLGGSKQAVLLISPKLNNKFDNSILVDKNIVFENNTINTFNPLIVDAMRVNNLTIRNNEIIQNSDFLPFNSGAALLNIENCKMVLLDGNKYIGNNDRLLKIDLLSKPTSVINGENGFKSKIIKR
ncbi:MAG: right-handed parallel beta-helix repeat-containing protein [Paludibacter sp.]|nr:right-handed parallel beta-helix repeat-containing protein [Paludibacter sp.]